MPADTPYSSTDWFSNINPESSLRNRTLKSVSVTLIGQVLNLVINTVGMILLARILTPTDFGLVTMVLVLSLPLQSFGVSGLVEAIVQKDVITHNLLSAVFWLNITISTILAIIFCFGASVISEFYKEPALKGIASAMALTILFGGVSCQHQALLIRKMSFLKTTSNELVATILSLTIAVWLAIHGWGYWALVAKWIASTLFTALGTWMLCRWLPSFTIWDSGVKSIFKYSLYAYGNFLIFYYAKNLDKTLIGRFKGGQSLGFYDRAHQLALIVPNQLLNPLSNVAQSALSKISNAPEKYRMNYLKMLYFLGFVAFPVSIFMAVIANDLIPLILGPKWINSVPIFIAFCLYAGMYTLFATHAWLHLSLGTTDRWLRWSVIAITVDIISILVGFYLSGILGMAVGHTVSVIILVLPAIWYGGRPVQLPISDIFVSIWKSFVSAVLAGVICWQIFDSANFEFDISSHFNMIARIIIFFVGYVPIYLAFIILLYRSILPIKEIFNILSEIRNMK